jgi:riboflavin biosynthesis pyrimidine reductase
MEYLPFINSSLALTLDGNRSTDNSASNATTHIQSTSVNSLRSNDAVKPVFSY